MCDVKGCRNKAVAKGLCAKHYMRQQRTGDPTSKPRKPGPKPKPQAAFTAAAKPTQEAKPAVDMEAALLKAEVAALQAELARTRQRREAKAEPEIDLAWMSMTAKQKFDAAIRQHKRKLDIEFEERVLAECKRRLDDISLPHYAKELKELERSISNRKGIMNRATFNLIRSCLHPDSRGAVSDKKLYDAFHAFAPVEKNLLNEKESPTEFRNMPRTFAELMAARAKVQADRRAKRAASKANAMRRR